MNMKDIVFEVWKLQSFLATGSIHLMFSNVGFFVSCMTHKHTGLMSTDDWFYRIYINIF